MDKVDLGELAERVEKLDGPDRGIDGWIHAHMTRGERYIIGQEEGRFPRPPIYGERLDVMHQLADPADAAEYIGAPRYTASLDTAMSLVPEGWYLGCLTECNEDEMPHCCLTENVEPARDAIGRGIDLPTSVVAAALRAHLSTPNREVSDA